MEYIYAVLLVSKAGKEVNEENVTAALKAVGVDVDAAKVKSLIAALDGVDIDTVIAESSVAVAAAPAAGAAPAADAAPAAEKKEEKAEEQPAADAAAGLGALF